MKGGLTVNEPNGSCDRGPIGLLVCRVSNGIQAICKRQKRYQDMVTKSGLKSVSKVEKILGNGKHIPH